MVFLFLDEMIGLTKRQGFLELSGELRKLFDWICDGKACDPREVGGVNWDVEILKQEVENLIRIEARGGWCPGRYDDDLVKVDTRAFEGVLAEHVRMVMRGERFDPVWFWELDLVRSPYY